MAKVSPSILSADFVNLERDLRAIAQSGADYIHVDVMDGQFVPNLTIGMPVVQAIARVSELPLDVHLMIDRPIRYVEGFCKAGASILAVHLESDTPEGIRMALERTRALGVRSALALKPGTPAEAALTYLELCDMILVMDHGQIVERGTHEELLAKEGRYYELWNMQQGIYRSKKKAEPKQPVMQAVVEEDDDGESITY